jgi:subfamily B ATP-binding cassette protein MsbA
MVLPYSTKYLVDDVLVQHRSDLIWPLAGVVLLATALQGATTFALTQTVSKAAQRLIAELREKVQEHVGRLPVAYYDANKAGALVSRIMSDVEGVRNLIGTGLVDLVGGLLTALFALIVLVTISPLMTGLAAIFLVVFGFGFAPSSESAPRLPLRSAAGSPNRSAESAWSRDTTLKPASIRRSRMACGACLPTSCTL